jgi:hypothetical protein
MSERLRVSLAHENVAYAGVVVFDGEVLETLGFAENASSKMPIELIDEVALEDDYLNAFSNPEKGDSYGIQLPIDPSDSERVALQELVDSIQAAIDARGSG